ncbi:MAG: hypothetical protein ACE5LU_28145, partial [Anaerolineae bacterium]
VLRRVAWTSTASIVDGLLHFAFYIGVPYVALLRGVITPQSLGLVVASQSESLNQGALVAVGAVALMGLIGWHYRREVISLGEDAHPPLDATRQLLGRPWGWVLVLVSVICQQSHWAFYRALPFLILDDRYMGGFLGLALVMLEAYANPRVRDDLKDRAGAEFLLLSAGFAVVTTILFILTGTSWLGGGTHLAVAIGWILLVQAQQRRQPRES